MYEIFIMYTDHNALHWLFDNYQAVRKPDALESQTSWVRFSSEIQTRNANQQAEALSRRGWENETGKDNDDDDIPLLLFDDAADTRHTDCSEPDFINLDFLSSNEVHATQEIPNPNNTAFTSIELDQLVSRQVHDRFCTKIQRSLNNGVVLAFDFNDDGLSIRNAKAGPHVVMPGLLK